MAKLDCWTCKTPIVEGQYLSIEQMYYHAQCFKCERCSTNLYGKQFAPVGDPKTPTWKIYCSQCDNYNASRSEINYNDVRPANEKRTNPAQKPTPKQPVQEPPPSPAPSSRSTFVKEASSIFQEQEDKRLRQERLRKIEDEEKEKKKQESREHLNTAAKMRDRQRHIDQQEQERIAQLKEQDEKDHIKMRQDALNYQAERKARVEAELASPTSSSKEIFIEENPPQSPYKSGISSTTSPRAGASSATSPKIPSSPPAPPSTSGGGIPPPPPPMASSGVPPPPPPPAMSGGGRRAPPPVSRYDDDDSGSSSRPPESSEPGRNALLDSIKNFRSNRLRPTSTNDRSAPIIDSRDSGGGGGSGGGGRLPPGARGVAGNPMAAMAAAIASRRNNT